MGKITNQAELKAAIRLQESAYNAAADALRKEAQLLRESLTPIGIIKHLAGRLPAPGELKTVALDVLNGYLTRQDHPEDIAKKRSRMLHTCLKIGLALILRRRKAESD